MHTRRCIGILTLCGGLLLASALPSVRAANWQPGLAQWPGAVIPYWVSSPALQPKVAAAVKEWNARTGMKWVHTSRLPGFRGDYYVDFAAWTSDNPVVRGSAVPGRQDGRNIIGLSPAAEVPDIVHEMGHEMGLLHEHNRVDRTPFIRFADDEDDSFLCGFDFIQRAVNSFESGANYYKTQICPKSGEPLGPYDYASLMHYPAKRRTTYCVADSMSASHCYIVDGYMTSKTPTPITGGRSISWWDAYWISAKYNTTGRGDLVAINRAHNGTTRTVVTRVSGAGAQAGLAFTSVHSTLVTWFSRTLGDRFAYAMGDYDNDGVDDLWLLIDGDVGAGNLQVRILDGASNYTTQLIHATTSIPMKGGLGGFGFAAGDWDRDGVADLILFERDGPAVVVGGGRATIFHAWNGKGTAQFPPFTNRIRVYQLTPNGVTTDANTEFAVGYRENDPNLDLFLIHRQGFNGIPGTTVQIVNGRNGVSTYLKTALGPAGMDWHWKVADWDRDGRADLYGVFTTPERTEVHIMSGASNFASFMWQMATPLAQTNTGTWDFK
jgi:hypothetical protein